MLHRQEPVLIGRHMQSVVRLWRSTCPSQAQHRYVTVDNMLLCAAVQADHLRGVCITHRDVHITTFSTM